MADIVGIVNRHGFTIKAHRRNLIAGIQVTRCSASVIKVGVAYTAVCVLRLGLSQLCLHNFWHDRAWKA